MSNTINGKIFVVGDDIDTDQIIPAQYLNLLPNVPEERKKLGSYAFAGLPDDYPKFIESDKDESPYMIVVAGKNFGCGSSREHAPIALNAAGIKAVIAESYSRIFFRNSINAGLLYPYQTPAKVYDQFKNGDEVEINLDSNEFVHKGSGKTFPLNSLGDVEAIIKAGGIFQYAKDQGIN